MNKNINDRYWMKIALQVAQASTCRVKVGTVLVHNNQIVGTGYVGSVSGDAHCEDQKCLFVDNHGQYGSDQSGKSCIRTIHSEMNAVLKCAIRGSEQNRWISAYCTHCPCLVCLKVLLQIGVRKIVYSTSYNDYNRELYLGDLYCMIKLEFIYMDMP